MHLWKRVDAFVEKNAAKTTSADIVINVNVNNALVGAQACLGSEVLNGGEKSIKVMVDPKK